jgi:hypothetical protein
MFTSLQQRVLDRFATVAKSHVFASKFIKIVLIALGSLCVGIIQFLQIPSGESISPLQVAGISASLLIFVGAVLISFTEQDASEDLRLAHEALERARDAEYYERWSENTFDNYNKQLERANHLYLAIMVMRESIEQTILSAKRDIQNIVDDLMFLAERPLSIALGIDQSDEWVIAVYKAELDSSGQYVLRCIQHARAIKCKIEEARVWPSGVGAAGQAFAMSSEIVVPDLASEDLGTIFHLNGPLGRNHDFSKYRSMAAVPIRVSDASIPWGVVVGTCNRARHFDLFEDDEESGVQPIEAVKALAGMVALAVSVSRIPPTTDEADGDQPCQES